MHYVLFLSWLHVSQHSSGAHWRRQVVHHRPASKIPESLVAGHYALRCWIGWTCRAALRTKGRSSRRSRIPPRRRRRQSLLNPSGEPIPDSPAAQHAVGSSLARRASDTNFDRICLYLVRIAYRVSRPGSVRDAKLRDQKISYIAGYTTWPVQEHQVLA